MTDAPLQAATVPAPRAARAVGVAALVWSAAILSSRVVGLVRDAVLGRTLGVGGEADVYSAAFMVPDFVNYLLAGGILSLTFIPIFGRHLRAGDERRGWDSFSDIANALLVLALPLTLAVALAMPWIAPWIAGGFDAAKQAELVRLTRIILPAQVFLMLGAMLSGTLQARDRHAVAAFSPASYTIGIIVVGAAFYARLGAEAFAWGVLAGASLGAFAIPLSVCLRGGMTWRPRLDFRNPDLRRYAVLALPVMLGQSIVALDAVLWKWQGTHLAEGSVAALTYAYRLLNVPAGMFGLAAGAAAYPTLVRLEQEKRPAEAYALLTQAGKTTLLLAFLSQALLTVCGEDAVRAVFGFRTADVGAIAPCVSLFSLALGAWSLHPLLARGFYARGNTWAPTLLGTAVTVLVVPLYVFLRSVAGAPGLAIASSAALVAYVVPLHFALRRAVRRDVGPDVALPRWSGFLVRSVLALAATIATLHALRLGLVEILPGTGVAESLVRIGVVAAAGVPLFLVAARLFGVEEAHGLSVRIVGAASGALARVRGRR
jgi:putative peptidoglycan lipid II flippase